MHVTDQGREDHGADSGQWIAGQQMTGRRQGRRRLVITILIVLLILLGGYALLGLLYRGPRNLHEVAMVMPGVPIFPLSTIAPGNNRTQHALAIPLCLIRMQGVKRVEAALLQAPADVDFILDWYRTTSPKKGWTLIDQEAVSSGQRLLFARGGEGFQIIVGQTTESGKPVQLIYLNGLSKQHFQQLIEMPGSVPPPAVSTK